MNVTFWGTRGSIATPGSSTVRFGGNTSCVDVITDRGTRLILDCGTGVRLLGDYLTATSTAPINGHIFLTHTHWDHIQGFPFFWPAFVEGNTFDIYGPADGVQSLENALRGQMHYTYFPVELENVGADITCNDLSEGAFQLEDVLVWSQFLNHPAPTLGYRFEVGGITVAYCTDHEPFFPPLFRRDAQNHDLQSVAHAGDRRHAEFLAASDLVIHDAQYTENEYENKRQWGHSPFEYVVRICLAAGVKQLALFHHDPKHDDDTLDQMEDDARRIVADHCASMRVWCAREGTTVRLNEGPAIQPLGQRRPGRTAGGGPTTIVLITSDDRTKRAIERALGLEGYAIRVYSAGKEALVALSDVVPDLVLADSTLTDIDPATLLSELALHSSAPVIVLTEDSDPNLAEKAFALGASDQLNKPPAPAQLRARVNNWLQRSRRGAPAPS